MKQACVQPFTAIEIDINGNVFTCCPSFINYYNIGNIYESKSLEELWNSEKARNLREKILNNDYSLCNLELCRQRRLESAENLTANSTNLPKYITLAYDKECNLQCITCRDKKYKNSLQEKETFKNKIDELLIPLLKEAEIVALSGSGEAFYSSHSRALIKKLAATNKTIKFNINTNGILFNQSNCNSLGLKNRINEVFVSLPALTPNIYKKIMIGSNLKTVINNIKWMAKAQKEKQINKITINTVISSLNYKEIPLLVNFAKELDIFISISQYYWWGTEFGKNYEDVSVWDKRHECHADFVEQLKSVHYEKLHLSPLFEELKYS